MSALLRRNKLPWLALQIPFRPRSMIVWLDSMLVAVVEPCIMVRERSRARGWEVAVFGILRKHDSNFVLQTFLPPPLALSFETLLGPMWAKDKHSHFSLQACSTLDSCQHESFPLQTRAKSISVKNSLRLSAKIVILAASEFPLKRAVW